MFTALLFGLVLQQAGLAAPPVQTTPSSPATRLDGQAEGLVNPLGATHAPRLATAKTATGSAASNQPASNLVCQNRARTGSVLTRQVCYTPRQVAANTSVAQQYVEEIQRPMANDKLPD